VRADRAQLRRIRSMLVADTGFRAFHEGRSDVVPEYYHRQFEARLGRFAGLISRADRTPVHEASTTTEVAAPPLDRTHWPAPPVATAPGRRTPPTPVAAAAGSSQPC
jgi:hypothetical protein